MNRVLKFLLKLFWNWRIWFSLFLWLLNHFSRACGRNDWLLLFEKCHDTLVVSLFGGLGIWFYYICVHDAVLFGNSVYFGWLWLWSRPWGAWSFMLWRSLSLTHLNRSQILTFRSLMRRYLHLIHSLITYRRLMRPLHYVKEIRHIWWLDILMLVQSCIIKCSFWVRFWNF